MGPLRSLYEQEGELERAVMRQASGGGAVMLRPVQMSDCGKQDMLPLYPRRAVLTR